MVRLINFADGWSSSAAPSVGAIPTNTLQTFADDASFVASKGVAAANGDTYYNTTDNVIRVYRAGAWEYLLQPLVTGSRGAAQAIVAASGVAFTGKQINNFWFVAGSGGPVTISANPQIAAGAFVGQMLRLFGTDDTNTVTLSHGTGLSLLDANVILGNGDSILLMWDGTNWAEHQRSA